MHHKIIKCGVQICVGLLYWEPVNNSFEDATSATEIWNFKGLYLFI